MLPKINRADRRTLENVFKNGRFVNATNLTFKFIHQNSDSPCKISFISPKTVSKSAVVRNLLRRRGYAILKKYPQFLQKKGLIGAFIFGKKSLSVFGGKKTSIYNPFVNLEREVIETLKKATEHV